MTLSYSVTCSVCQTKFNSEKFDNPHDFIRATGEDGWEIPDILANKPIKCPICKVK